MPMTPELVSHVNIRLCINGLQPSCEPIKTCKFSDCVVRTNAHKVLLNLAIRNLFDMSLRWDITDVHLATNLDSRMPDTPSE